MKKSRWILRGIVLALLSCVVAAIVYRHLDRKWIDPETRQTRMLSESGWNTSHQKTAGLSLRRILDRFEAMKRVYLSYNDKWLKVTNANPFAIEGLTLISHHNQALYQDGEVLQPNKDKEIVFGTRSPFATRAFIVIPE